MTDEEKNEIINAIRAESVDVNDLEKVETLDDATSLPATQNGKVVTVPISLLAKPAIDAAANADAAAEHAEEEANKATEAAVLAKKAAEEAQSVSSVFESKLEKEISDRQTADTENKNLIEGDPETVKNNIRNPFIYLGNFDTWTETQVELDKLHSQGEDDTKVGEFRMQLNNRNLIVRNFVQDRATGVFTQTVQGPIRWNDETQTMDQSLNIKTYERRYNEGTGWTTWEEGTAKIELAQELSTEEGSENKAISQKAVSKEINAIKQTSNDLSFYEKCKFSDTKDAINYVSELYVEGLDDIVIPEEGLRLDITQTRIVQIWNGRTCLCDFRGTSDMQYIYCKMPQYQNSGVTAYAVVDFSNVTGTKSFYLKNKNAITSLSLCPYIKAIFNDGKIDNNIANLQKRYALKSDISWIISEAYFDGISDKDTPLELRIINQNMTTGFLQLWQGSVCLCDYRKPIAEVKGVINMPEYNKSGVNGYVIINNLLDIQPKNGTKTVILDNNGCTDLSLNPYIASLYNGLKIDDFEKIILEGSFKWKGKNILVIGDSMTADGRWQKKMGELLGANIFTHALGGITTEVMVDGNGSSFPALSQSDVEDKDAIIIMGFYNDRRLANTNLGDETDLHPSQTTFIGKLNYAIKRIYEELANANNLKCRVIIASAHRWGIISEEDDGDKWGQKLLEGCQIAGKANGCPVFNLMDNAGMNKYTWDVFARSSSDELHLNEDGYNRVGEYIASQMNTL